MLAKIELHSHASFFGYGLREVLEAMEQNDIDIFALSGHNRANFSEMIKLIPELEQHGYEVEDDGIAIVAQNGGKPHYILRSIEMHTPERLHVLAVGYDHKNGVSGVRETIDNALNEGAFVGLCHPFVNVGGFWDVFKPISPEKREELTELCMEYSKHVALEWNGLFGNCLLTCIRNPNQEVLNLSSVLLKNEFINPVFTATDIHARIPLLLRGIGTSYIETDVDVSSGRTIVYSLKTKLFEDDDYKVTPQTVGLTQLRHTAFEHFYTHFCRQGNSMY